MANNCTMVEFTNALEEDEIELSLGLSIGGSLRKSKQVEKELVRSTDINTDLKENDNIFLGSSVSPVHIVDIEADMRLDPQTKRAIHAMQRQEARRKREEKQLKKGISRARNGEYAAAAASCGFENGDKRKLEANEDGDHGVAERVCKREKVETQTIGYEYGEERKQSLNQNLELEPTVYTSSQPYPVVSMQYPYPQVQYVPFANGFAFPYVIPCWVAGAAGSGGNDKNVIHPVACRSFRPLQAHRNCDSEQNSGKDCGNGKPVSKGSPGCSSSAISENRTTSLQGGSRSDSGSDSNHSKSRKPQLDASTGSDTPDYSEHSASSQPLESGQGIDKETNYTEKVVFSSITQSSNTKPMKEAASETQPDPINKPISTPLKEIKDMSKPLKPQTQNDDIPSLPQMPCVSTTGNGPNGKTITGFLYRYTKTEVFIVCVCHGSSFSPAEFVEHAGGIDVSHPLRHITVVSSPFG